MSMEEAVTEVKAIVPHDGRMRVLIDANMPVARHSQAY
jgi:hypothetical protein